MQTQALHDQFVIGAQHLSEKLEVHHLAAKDAVIAKADHDTKAAEARVYGLRHHNEHGEVTYLSWSELGKNDKEREANWTLLFPAAYPDEFLRLRHTERKLDDAKHDLEQARLSWDLLRYRLRLLEVEARLSPEGTVD